MYTLNPLFLLSAVKVSFAFIEEKVAVNMEKTAYLTFYNRRWIIDKISGVQDIFFFCQRQISESMTIREYRPSPTLDLYVWGVCLHRFMWSHFVQLAGILHNCFFNFCQTDTYTCLCGTWQNSYLRYSPTTYEVTENLQ